MYVRVEFNCQRRYIKIDNIDELTFQQFVKMGKIFKQTLLKLKLIVIYHKYI